MSLSTTLLFMLLAPQLTGAGAKAARSEHEDAALRGVLALAKKSDKRRYVLFGPHDFGGVRVECAMLDTGCNAA